MKTVFPALTMIAIFTCATQCLGQGADVPTAIAIAPDGYVYVTGAGMNAAGLMEYRTLAYNPSGTLLGTRTFPTTASGAGIPAAIAVSGDTIVITGVHPEASTGYDIVTIAYSKTSLTPVKSTDELPRAFRLEQSYPNPVSPRSEALITYTLPVAGNIRLVVIDAGGKEVVELTKGWKQAGTYTTGFVPGVLPAGTYYYSLQSSALSETRKLAVIGSR